MQSVGINSTSKWLLIAWGEKLYEKTCYGLLIINFAKLTVHCNKYEYVWDSQVCGIQVYSKLLLQVYKFTVHQIVYSKLLLLTSHWPISELLHFFHCLHVQENMLQHYLVIISLLLKS